MLTTQQLLFFINTLGFSTRGVQFLIELIEYNHLDLDINYLNSEAPEWISDYAPINTLIGLVFKDAEKTFIDDLESNLPDALQDKYFSIHEEIEMYLDDADSYFRLSEEGTKLMQELLALPEAEDFSWSRVSQNFIDNNFERLPKGN